MPTVSPMEKRPSALQRNCETVWLPLAMTVKRAYTVANVRFGPSPTLAIPLGVSDVSASLTITILANLQSAPRSNALLMHIS